MAKRIIGVTDCSKYEAYAKWITGNGDVEVLKLSYRDNSFGLIEKCHGIVLTGGEDVHPAFYKKPEYLSFCYKEDMDERRDQFEFDVLSYTTKNKVPVLGICRGLQVANVFYGGTLIPDIPSFGKFNHSKKDGADTYHNVTVDPNSWLKKIAEIETGEINSAHHQSAEMIAPELVSSAISQDGVVEALEWKDHKNKQYLMLVQWHPERMRDQENPLTKKIRFSFIDAVNLT